MRKRKPRCATCRFFHPNRKVCLWSIVNDCPWWLKRDDLYSIKRPDRVGSMCEVYDLYRR